MTIFKLCIFFLCMGWCIAAPGDGAPYQPDHSLRILTQQGQAAPDDSTDDPADSRIWRVAVAPDPAGGEYVLSFYREASDRSFCRVTLDDSGAVTAIDIPGMPRNMMLQDRDLLIAPGYPLPCDILPYHRMMAQNPGADPVVYQTRRGAGSPSISVPISVTTYAVSRETAMDHGWLKDSENAPESLMVVEAVHAASKEPMVLQVWVPGEDWWRYEQTPSRRSWQLP